MMKRRTFMNLTAGAAPVTYYFEGDYADPVTQLTSHIVCQITLSQIKTGTNAVYVLVTNPCDVLAVAAQRITGLPTSQIFASGTVLDSSRLRWLLSERVGVATSSVHAMIVGEHGDSEFPL